MNAPREHIEAGLVRAVEIIEAARLKWVGPRWQREVNAAQALKLLIRDEIAALRAEDKTSNTKTES